MDSDSLRPVIVFALFLAIFDCLEIEAALLNSSFDSSESVSNCTTDELPDWLLVRMPTFDVHRTFDHIVDPELVGRPRHGNHSFHELYSAILPFLICSLLS